MTQSAKQLYDRMYGEVEKKPEMSNERFHELINKLPEDIRSMVIIPEHRKLEVSDEKESG